MKKSVALCLAFFAALSLSFTGCKKYDDGPAISLLPKKERLCRMWKPDKYIKADGTETAAGSDDARIEFKKDERFFYHDGGTSYEGTWSWSDSKEAVRVTYPFIGSVNISAKYTILRLTKDELWVKDEDGDKTYYKAG